MSSTAALSLQRHVNSILNLLNNNFQNSPAVTLQPSTEMREISSFYSLFLPFDKVNTSVKLPGRKKHCYEYSFKAALYRPGLIYCEGLAVPKIKNFSFPIDHAWCVDEDTGEVIDPTWKGRGCGVAYAGIPLREDFVKLVALKTEVYGVFGGFIPRFVDTMRLSDIIHPAYLDKVINSSYVG